VLPVYVSAANIFNGICLAVYSAVAGYIETFVTACFITALSLLTVLVYVTYMLKSAKTASSTVTPYAGKESSQCSDDKDTKEISTVISSPVKDAGNETTRYMKEVKTIVEG